MQYEIIYGDSAAELKLKVEGELIRGWKPQGGVSVICTVGENIYFYQAIMKE